MIEFFFGAYRDTSWLNIGLESIVFVFGILSVWYAGKENILVYPTGLIATIITVYLLYLAGYLGDMILNGYYSCMSIYGWYNWSRMKEGGQVVQISRTNGKEKGIGVFVFVVTIVLVYAVYRVTNTPIAPENYIDIFTSGVFFLGMYYMALKKIENWTMWLIGNIISVPLYAYRGLGILAIQFIIFTVLVIQAYLSWYKILKQEEKKYG
ncbi:nicotinamide mononucleotide transporter [Myroides sp. 1354]|uniref:nicotinamide riboside transporter PnuC n=1 Tax=unclassified Myroides TaxID=2642485 RepID=UPI002575F31D|nr:MULTISPECIES: nicotinamide riboside transporter PnuC [unclassified Myroides]MDM1044038.1 nicotinamide mononucleotide transporter [Myroides sp. R163-1]MDM1054973.1 nicotinamide mononucleotide transporter [Myroides sp. 1354]MDM1068270.1 nicotinamide mononucleotide transporter [Myroides sp. 1372]